MHSCAKAKNDNTNLKRFARRVSSAVRSALFQRADVICCRRASPIATCEPQMHTQIKTHILLDRVRMHAKTSQDNIQVDEPVATVRLKAVRGRWCWPV